MVKRPNILFIMSDQQRCDSIGCYGADYIKTPNLDSLARDGIRYDGCYTANAICTPSRASIMTGKPLPGHGVYRLHDILPQNEKLFPFYLKEAGYKTALLGKLHVSGRSFEREQRNANDGFDIYEYAMNPHDLGGSYNSYALWLKEHHPDFYRKLGEQGRAVKDIPEEAHFTTWSAERTMDFIRKQSEDGGPFFAYMSVVDPHDPYGDYPVKALESIEEQALPKPHGLSEEAVHRLPEPVVREHEHCYLGSFHQFSAEAIQTMRKGYYASAAFLDRQIGRVISCLKELGLYDDTLIIFMSDHGDMLGDHGLLVKGDYFFDECTRVPLIIKPVRANQMNKAVKGLVQTYDIAAAILCAAGLEPELVRNIMPDSCDLLEAEFMQNGRQTVQCMYRNTGIGDQKVYFSPPIHATMIRDRTYKLNLFHGAPEDGLQGELYCMETDPREEENLWDNCEYADVKCRLLVKLCNWLAGQETSLLGSRGGELFPDKSQWLSLNAL